MRKYTTIVVRQSFRLYSISEWVDVKFFLPTDGPVKLTLGLINSCQLQLVNANTIDNETSRLYST